MTSLMSEAQKQAEEWRNAAEKAELKSDPFPVVGWAASKTFDNSFRVTNERSSEHSVMTP